MRGRMGARTYMTNNYLQWLAATDTIWWHDSADPRAADAAIQNGAVGMTTNPFLIASTLTDPRAGWTEAFSAEWGGPKEALGAKASRDEGSGAYARDIGALSGDEKALELEMRVGARHAATFRQFWGIKRGAGGVCVQVNPAKPGDAALMTEQVRKIGPLAPNICVKTPATHAGLVAFEEGVALGFNMVSTLSFTVAQCVAAAEAYERGAARARSNGITPGFSAAVMMLGRLDDYLRDVAADGEYGIPERAITHAGIACMKKAYGIFQERGYRTMLMSAAARGIYHITELAGANIIMSIAPSIERTLLTANPEQAQRADRPIDALVIDQLLELREFQKAYDERGMDEGDFITYGPTNRTATQFTEKGWNILLNC